MTSRLFLLIMGLVFSAPAYSVSFDCAKAGGSAEQLICSSPELSSADDKLALVYKRTLTLRSDNAPLKQGQRQWLYEVRDQCTEIECLKQAYAERITALSAELEAASESSATDQHTSITTAFGTGPDEQHPANPTPRANHLSPATINVPTAGGATLPDAEIINDSAAPLGSSHVQDHARPAQGPSKTLILKIIGVLLIVNAVIAMYLHRRARLTIYTDYTDAAVTGFWPLLAIMSYLVLRFLEVPEDLALNAALGLFSVMFVLVVLATYRANGFSPYFIMALLAKLTIVGAYYAVMAGLLLAKGTGRQKGERKSSYEARQRRESRQRAAAMAGATTAFAVVSVWLCRDDRFTPLGRYLSIRR